MSAALIYRPQYQIDFEDNFTALPNSLFNLGRYFDDVKPLHTAVYNYLLTKREKWNIQPSDIAKAQNIGESTARRALTKLRKLGLMSFERHPKGGGQWCVEVPEFLLEKPLSLDKSPLRQKPLVEKPLVQNDVALVKNDLLEKNEKTTNAVVVSLPDYVNNGAVKKELSTLEKTQQALVLGILAAAMTAGKVKNPVSYAIGLAKKAKDGLLSAPVVVDKTGAKPVDKKKQEFIKRNFDKLKRQLTNVERINIAHPTYDGWIYAKDLEEFEGGRS